MWWKNSGFQIKIPDKIQQLSIRYHNSHFMNEEKGFHCPFLKKKQQLGGGVVMNKMVFEILGYIR